MTMESEQPAEGGEDLNPPMEGSPRPAKADSVDKKGESGLDDPSKTKGKAEGER